MSSKFNFDSSGTFKDSTTEELAKADLSSAIIALSTGVQGDGTPYYVYLAIPPSKYAEFYRLSKEGQSINLENYGVIIAGGPQEQPPEIVTEYMKEEYGFDENFEQALDEEFRKESGALGQQREDARIMDIVAMLKSQKPAE